MRVTVHKEGTDTLWGTPCGHETQDRANTSWGVNARSVASCPGVTRTSQTT